MHDIYAVTHMYTNPLYTLMVVVLICGLQVLGPVMVAQLQFNIKVRSAIYKPCSTEQREEWKKLRSMCITYLTHFGFIHNVCICIKSLYL